MSSLAYCARHLHALTSSRDLRRVTMSSRGHRQPLRIGIRAVASTYTDIEALWQKVDFGRERAKTSMEWETLKESCWYAAYDAPFHGVPSGPYMGGRVADMNAHITRRHHDFLVRSRRALCGHTVTPEEFADTLARVSSVLGVGLTAAVQCVFEEPTILAMDTSELIRTMVELRRQHEDEDLVTLVISQPALLGRAVECEPDGHEAAAADDVFGYPTRADNYMLYGGQW